LRSGGIVSKTKKGSLLVLPHSRERQINAAQPAHTPDHPEHDEHSHEHGHTHELTAEEASFYSVLYRAIRENQDLRVAYDTLLHQTVHALMKCLEERDAYTYGHSMRVMEYSSLIAKGANLKYSDVQNIEMAAMFHDLGKIGIPDCVLLKPERLDSSEGKVIREHPVKSAAILSLIDAFKNVTSGVLHHHERFDGKGYPDKLVGDKIPLYSRVILVADTFDAMTSTRPYRKARPVEDAYAEIERFSGTQFDPEFVKIFLEEHKKLMQAKSPKAKVKIKKAA
jgi:HD-GYP domain-containing protein (c-di-GMP phosphodiesterase class II)